MPPYLTCIFSWEGLSFHLSLCYLLCFSCCRVSGIFFLDPRPIYTLQISSHSLGHSFTLLSMLSCKCVSLTVTIFASVLVACALGLMGTRFPEPSGPNAFPHVLHILRFSLQRILSSFFFYDWSRAFKSHFSTCSFSTFPSTSY